MSEFPHGILELWSVESQADSDNSITPILHYDSISHIRCCLKLLIWILPTLTPDQQVGRLKEQYVFLRGKGAVVRALVGELPVRQYISLLERGYRVALERDGESFVLVLHPDGSTPRLGLAWRAFGGEPSRRTGLY